ncbi:MAG: hypothetical protein KBT75_12725 [Oleispira antarctica]|nr:hypothetical protein [Oleispira antarctica]MBQ0793089.1 hypothetical protein [Oleispira antarctica]
MKYLIKILFLLLINTGAYAAPAIEYQHDQQRYTFPELTISANVFFTELSQYSGIDIYYYPELIIPNVFRGISLHEDELLRLLDKNFSLIKSFKNEQLASLQILPEGQIQSNNLRHAGSLIVELSQSSNALQEHPALLSDQRVRVLKAKERREKIISELKVKQENKKEQKDQKKNNKKIIRAQKKAKKQQEELIRLKRYQDTDKEIYERLLPFYKHQFGEPDFSKINNSNQP